MTKICRYFDDILLFGIENSLHYLQIILISILKYKIVIFASGNNENK